MERYLLRMVVVLAVWLAVASVASAQTAVEYIHTDALGTPVAVTNSAGAVIERSVYEPYGQLINRPLTDGPGFTGHVQDAATGLTYMQQRYYDPQAAVFLSVDPVSALGAPPGLFNRYRYANHNPFSLKDPDGRQAKGLGGPCDLAPCRKNHRTSNNEPDNSLGARYTARGRPTPKGKQPGPHSGQYVYPKKPIEEVEPVEREPDVWQFTAFPDGGKGEAGFVAAYGLGVTGAKGLNGGKDKLGACVLCVGESASVDYTIFTIKHGPRSGGRPSQSSVNVSTGGDVHGIWGFSADLKLQGTNVELSLKTGPGLGASFRGINVETEIE